MAKKGLKTGILGIVILMVGVIVGLILIDQTQDFRNTAKEQNGKGYTVCHKEEVPGGIFWYEVTIGQGELSIHLNHGDIFGKCPDANSN